LLAKKSEKKNISKGIVAAIRSQYPPGRFLELKKKNSLYHEIGDVKAVEKTSQALREGQPEIMEKMQVLQLQLTSVLGKLPLPPTQIDSPQSLDFEPPAVIRNETSKTLMPIQRKLPEPPVQLSPSPSNDFKPPAHFSHEIAKPNFARSSNNNDILSGSSQNSSFPALREITADSISSIGTNPASSLKPLQNNLQSKHERRNAGVDIGVFDGVMHYRDPNALAETDGTLSNTGTTSETETVEEHDNFGVESLPHKSGTDKEKAYPIENGFKRISLVSQCNDPRIEFASKSSFGFGGSTFSLLSQFSAIDEDETLNSQQSIDAVSANNLNPKLAESKGTFRSSTSSELSDEWTKKLAVVDHDIRLSSTSISEDCVAVSDDWNSKQDLLGDEWMRRSSLSLNQLTEINQGADLNQFIDKMGEQSMSAEFSGMSGNLNTLTTELKKAGKMETFLNSEPLVEPRMSFTSSSSNSRMSSIRSGMSYDWTSTELS